MRLIDADALTDVIEGTDWYHLTEIGTMAHGAVSGDNAWFREGDIFEALDEAPTIDAVPVVRCKDCKHYHSETGYCAINSYFVDGDGMSCSPAESPNWTMFEPDDFCSYGERKDGK